MPSYPLTFPTTPKFKSFVVRESYNTPASISPFTGDEQVFEYTGSGKINWDATIPPLKYDDAAVDTWIAFFADLHGRYGTFTLDITSHTTVDYVQGHPNNPSGGTSTIPTIWRSRDNEHTWTFNERKLFTGFTIRAVEA